jgi:hypothetical protein
VFDLLNDPGIPVDRPGRHWREQNFEPVDARSADPYTRCRISTMEAQRQRPSPAASCSARRRRRSTICARRRPGAVPTSRVAARCPKSPRARGGLRTCGARPDVWVEERQISEALTDTIRADRAGRPIEIIGALRHLVPIHDRREERYELPRLRDAVPAQELRQMARAVGRAEGAAMSQGSSDDAATAVMKAGDRVHEALRTVA